MFPIYTTIIREYNTEEQAKQIYNTIKTELMNSETVKIELKQNKNKLEFKIQTKR